MAQKAVTLKDVAAAANVSRATAARALNSYGYVGGETAQRVREAATRLGYQTNLVAQALRSGQLPIVGFVPGDIQNPFFARIARDLEAELRKQRYNVLIASSEEDVMWKRIFGVLTIVSMCLIGIATSATAATRPTTSRPVFPTRIHTEDWRTGPEDC